MQERSEGRDRHGRQPSRNQARSRSSRPTPPPTRAAAPAAALSSSERTAAALARLDEITRRLRRECPWDREQDERSIVPHTVEEAYELADAAHSGDDAKLLDELGDVLFQVYFLSLLLEERGAGRPRRGGRALRQKLIRRHPHVFGDVEAGHAPARWCATGTRSSATTSAAARSSARSPRTCPRTLYAKKVLKRAASAGSRRMQPARDPGERLLGRASREALDAGVDPELALRQAADEFRGRGGRQQ